MGVFADAADVLFADPERSQAWTYYAGGTGSGQAVTVLFSQPMRETGFGETGALARDIRATIRLSEIPNPKRGDTLSDGTSTYEVREARPDALSIMAALTISLVS